MPICEPADPLEFVDKMPYRQRLQEEQERTGLRDAAVVGTRDDPRPPRRLRGDRLGLHHGQHGLGGGRKAYPHHRTRHAAELPLIIISGSGGGARMHEGMLSLMQMAKVSAALARFDAAGGLFISVLTNPTMGGVAASFASLGDVVFAEPKRPDRLCRAAHHQGHDPH